MNTIWLVLVQFIFRLTFGVALSMGVTPSSLVTSGFYRVHLWVLMGMNTFAAMAVYSLRTSLAPEAEAARMPWGVVLGLAITLAVVSYAGSVIWLYEKAPLGGVVLYVIAIVALIAAAMATYWSPAASGWGMTLGFLELISSGMLLGATMSAMFLGHWYLNTPTMALAPLKRLVALMIGAVVVRSLLCGVGLALHVGSQSELGPMFWVWIGARWLMGLIGALAMGLLAWQTLKVPNTQSATGILYAGVIVTFMGELFSELLSVGQMFPL